MGTYCVIAKDNSGEWYAYHQDENGNYFSSKRDGCNWAEKNLVGWVWHIAQNC